MILRTVPVISALLLLVVPAAARTLDPGERAYQKCLACHALERKPQKLDGPPLRGVVGRKVAAVPGFDYSPAMKAMARKTPVWTRAALDAFLADPQAAAPDNKMAFFGVKDRAERAALVAWLGRR